MTIRSSYPAHVPELPVLFVGRPRWCDIITRQGDPQGALHSRKTRRPDGRPRRLRRRGTEPVRFPLSPSNAMARILLLHGSYCFCSEATWLNERCLSWIAIRIAVTAWVADAPASGVARTAMLFWMAAAGWRSLLVLPAGSTSVQTARICGGRKSTARTLGHQPPGVPGAHRGRRRDGAGCRPWSKSCMPVAHACTTPGAARTGPSTATPYRAAPEYRSPASMSPTACR